MNYFTNLIYEYGLLAMFLIILIEYACFPISSEIVLPFSGAVASLQHINYFTILFFSVLAGLIGTSFCYTIGRLGGGALLNKIIAKFPKAEKGIYASQMKFNQYGNFAVCFGRLIPICRTYIAFIAGAAGQSLFTYLVSSLIGITIWNAVLIGLGYLLRENWDIVGGYYTRYKDIILPLVVFLGMVILVHVRKDKSTKI
ncbi:DedA family protein [Anaerocolumna sedimenticola]|uniref:DedA family protein n=1 Tax=Anaerocolumna sedimenticola TaxID=2696063 RepID=A0A6P1TT13_9FIRM|nr:DedA family protein [Anaerocolumna sedimenticola]QHQ62618.1 DedA family protein [Anaerocolumna sedimenticola]